MSTLNFDVCDGKTFRDLCEDIIVRSNSKRDQLDTLLSVVRSYITSANDAQSFLPRIKELLEVGVKNDEQLVKLASVLQRLHSSQLDAAGGDPVGLSDEEKEQLLQSISVEKIKEIKSSVESELPIITPLTERTG